MITGMSRSSGIPHKKRHLPRSNKVQYSTRRLYRVERLGSELTSATPNCLRKCVIHMQVKIQFGVHIRGFTQFVIETAQAGFYSD
jgi:hypothetical protein